MTVENFSIGQRVRCVAKKIRVTPLGVGGDTDTVGGGG